MRKLKLLLVLVLSSLVSCAQIQEVKPQQICIEIPALIEGDTILNRLAYTIFYNKDTKCPYWVAWHLTAEHVDGDVPRDNSYYEDEEVPTPRRMKIIMEADGHADTCALQVTTSGMNEL